MTRAAKILRRCTLAAVLLATALAVLYAARGSLLPSLFDWLDVGQPPCRADCALVLGGDENTRPFVGAALWKAGIVPKVLLSQAENTVPTGAEIYPSSREVGYRVVRARGVDAADIVLLGQNLTTTFDEAQAMRGYVQRTSVKRLLLVTNDYHTRRARWIFRRALAGSPVELTVISAPNGRCSACDWWGSSIGFRLVISEYCKLAFYAVRYGGWGYALLGVVVGGLAVWAVCRRRSVRRRCKVAPTDCLGSP